MEENAKPKRRTRWRRRIILWGAVLVAIAAGGLFVTWVKIGDVGSTDVEQWIGRYLIQFVESYIHPRLRWGDLDYQAPYTVAVDDLSLDQDGVSILSVKHTTLGLAERPKTGQPLRFERIAFEQPRLSLIASPENGLLGWSNFIRSDAWNQLAAVSPDSVYSDASQQPAAAAPSKRLSDALQMKKLSIQDGEIHYDPSDGADAMVLDGIDVTLDTAQQAEDSGVYRLSGSLVHRNVAKFDVNGDINLNTGLLKLKHLVMKLELDESRYAQFPPMVQGVLSRYQVRGACDARFEGNVQLSRMTESDVRLALTLEKGRFALHETLVDIDRLSVKSHYEKNTVETDYEADLLGGHSEGRVRVALDDEGSVVADTRFDAIPLDLIAKFIPSRILKSMPAINGGSITGTVVASIPFDDWKRGTCDVVMAVSAFEIPILESKVSIPGLDLKAKLEHGGVAVDFKAKALGGKIIGAVKWSGTGDEPTHVHCVVTNVKFDQVRAILPAIAANRFMTANAASKINGEVDITFSKEAARQADASFDLAVTDAAFRGVGNSELRFKKLRLHGVASSSHAFDVQFECDAFSGSANGRIRRGAGQTEPVMVDLHIHNLPANQTLAAFGLNLALSEKSGLLTADASAALHIQDIRNSTSQAELRLSACLLEAGMHRIPINRLAITAKLEGRSVTADYRGEIMEGSAEGTMRLGLDSQLPLRHEWSIQNAQLQTILDAEGRPNERLNGRGKSTGEITVDLKNWRQTLQGTSQVTVEAARFVTLPVFTEVLDKLRSAVVRLSVFPKEHSDTGKFVLQIRPDCVVFDRFDIQNRFIAARGSGSVYYDRTIDLTISGGAVEKVQSLLGRSGKLLEKYTPQLYFYRVRGTLDEPRVTLEPRGLGAP